MCRDNFIARFPIAIDIFAIASVMFFFFGGGAKSFDLPTILDITKNHPLDLQTARVGGILSTCLSLQ